MRQANIGELLVVMHSIERAYFIVHRIRSGECATAWCVLGRTTEYSLPQTNDGLGQHPRKLGQGLVFNISLVPVLCGGKECSSSCQATEIINHVRSIQKRRCGGTWKTGEECHFGILGGVLAVLRCRRRFSGTYKFASTVVFWGGGSGGNFRSCQACFCSLDTLVARNEFPTTRDSCPFSFSYF